MPAGDPAAYLPAVRKSRKRKGQAPYQPRAKRGPGRYGAGVAGLLKAVDGSSPRPHVGGGLVPSKRKRSGRGYMKRAR